MSKMKLVVAGYAAAIALSALLPPPAPAEAAGWMVEGTQLVGTAKVISGGVGAATLTTPGGVDVTCTTKAFQMTEAEIIEASNRMAIQGFTLGSCSGTGACPLSGTVISMLPILLTEITLDGTSAIKGVLRPEAKTPLSAITFKGEECAVKGTQPLTGSLEFLAKEGQEERVSQLTLVASLAGELKLGSAAASMDFGLKFKLESGGNWSFL